MKVLNSNIALGRIKTFNLTVLVGQTGPVYPAISAIGLYIPRLHYSFQLLCVTFAPEVPGELVLQ